MNVPLQDPAFNIRDEPFLLRLKTGTDLHHRQLEAQALLQNLMLPTVTQKQYCTYLNLMHQVLNSYERTILPLLTEWLPWLIVRPSSILIKQDLEDLHPNGLQKLPSFNIDASKISLPDAWGFAYVIEGSKLGGKMIEKHIKKTLDIQDNLGTRYLNGSGLSTSTQWKEFLQQLNLYAACNVCEDEVIRGAILLFTSIHQYFEINGSQAN